LSPRGGLRIQLLLLLAVGTLLFLWRLHAVGQVDETPALFAAAGRAMAETGDWITPRVNGHPRFDKPVLIYWLIGLGTSWLPPSLDPLGSLAACLPSALATVAVMVALAITVRTDRGAGATAPLAAGLTFALSPLVLVWGRVSVSDPLLTACIAIALLGFGAVAAGAHKRRKLTPDVVFCNCFKPSTYNIPGCLHLEWISPLHMSSCVRAVAKVLQTNVPLGNGKAPLHQCPRDPRVAHDDTDKRS
jgi:hypothetical protein